MRSRYKAASAAEDIAARPVAPTHGSLPKPSDASSSRTRESLPTQSDRCTEPVWAARPSSNPVFFTERKDVYYREISGPTSAILIGAETSRSSGGTRWLIQLRGHSWCGRGRAGISKRHSWTRHEFSRLVLRGRRDRRYPAGACVSSLLESTHDFTAIAPMISAPPSSAQGPGYSP